MIRSLETSFDLTVNRTRYRPPDVVRVQFQPSREIHRSGISVASATFILANGKTYAAFCTYAKKEKNDWEYGQINEAAK
jgi:hypothetical protein